MDAKKAVQVAKAYVADLFADEQIEHVGLEEVRFDDRSNAWEITIGFSRPWDRGPLAMLPGPERRSYKIVRIGGETGRVNSVTHRTFSAPD